MGRSELRKYRARKGQIEWGESCILREDLGRPAEKRMEQWESEHRRLNVIIAEITKGKLVGKHIIAIGMGGALEIRMMALLSRSSMLPWSITFCLLAGVAGGFASGGTVGEKLSLWVRGLAVVFLILAFLLPFVRPRPQGK